MICVFLVQFSALGCKNLETLAGALWTQVHTNDIKVGQSRRNSGTWSVSLQSFLCWRLKQGDQV